MPENFVSMKREGKEGDRETAVELPEKSEFPHGLTIHLDEESIKKLGMSELPDVGDQFMVGAYSDVTDVHEGASQREGKSRSFTLQITHLELKPRISRNSPEKDLYGG